MDETDRKWRAGAREAADNMIAGLNEAEAALEVFLLKMQDSITFDRQRKFERFIAARVLREEAGIRVAGMALLGLHRRRRDVSRK